MKKRIDRKAILIILILVFAWSIISGFYIYCKMDASVGKNIYVISFRKGTSYFKPEDIDFLKEKGYYFTFAASAERNISSRTALEKADVVFTNESYSDIAKLHISDGGFFNTFHERKHMNVAVISREAAWKLFGGPPADFIDINHKPYRILGVFENNSVNRDDPAVYIPYQNSIPEEITAIMIDLNHMAEVHQVISMMGYSPDDINILDMELYKDIVSQRSKIIGFVLGLGAIVFIFKKFIKFVNSIRQRVMEFLKEHYVSDIKKLMMQKRFIGESICCIGCAASVMLLWYLIRFKVCIPPETLLNGHMDLLTILEFYLLPHINIAQLNYLNRLNLASNALFFIAVFSGGMLSFWKINTRN